MKSADGSDMPAWLSRVVDALSRSDYEPNEVHQTLETARRHRSKLQIELTGQSTAEHESLIMWSTIEQVRMKDFIIDQPTVGGITRPLATGEQMRISFSAEPTPLAGTTKSLGRIKIPSGGAKALFGYRLALPERLQPDERRTAPRVFVGLDLAAQVQLIHEPNSKVEPIRGVVDDLCVGGLRFHTRDMLRRLAPGKPVRIKVNLPMPIGVLDEPATVIHIEPGQQVNEHVIGVHFQREIKGMAELVQSLEDGQNQGR